MPNNFWMMINNVENFRITQGLGFTSMGLKSQHRRKVQRIADGDRVLMYVSHLRRFVATATATSSYVESDEPVWVKEGNTGFPFRINIRPEIVLEDFQFMDANLLAPRLEYVKRWPPENWYMAFQGNLHLLPKNDFLLIEEEMKKLKFGKDYKPAPVAPPNRSPARRRRSGNRRGRTGPEAEGQPVAKSPANG